MDLLVYYLYWSHRGTWNEGNKLTTRFWNHLVDLGEVKQRRAEISTISSREAQRHRGTECFSIERRLSVSVRSVEGLGSMQVLRSTSKYLGRLKCYPVRQSSTITLREGTPYG